MISRLSIRFLLGVVLTGPFLAIGLLSLSPTSGMDVYARPLEASFRWWRLLLHDPSWIYASFTSMFVATLSTSLALLITLPVAALARLQRSGVSEAILLFSGISYFVPPVVLALGFYAAFQLSGLFDTALGLGIAHLSVTIPVCAYVLWQRFSVSSDASFGVARGLGAPMYTAALTWVMSEHRATLYAAAAAAFMASMSEATLTLFLTDTQLITMSKRILQSISQDISPSGYAVMVIWIFVSAMMSFILPKQTFQE